jgi:peptidoglycan-associated lipoprotein
MAFELKNLTDGKFGADDFFMVLFMTALQAGLSSMIYTITEKYGYIDKVASAFGKKLDAKIGNSAEVKTVAVAMIAISLLTFSACHKKISSVEIVKTSQTSQNTAIEVNTTSAYEESVVEKHEFPGFPAGPKKRPYMRGRGNVNAESNINKDENPISFDAVYFSFDKAGIRKDNIASLNETIRTLKKDISIKIHLEGNCDSIGSAKYNKALGLRRVNSVKNYLLRAGISPRRISVTSLGKENQVCFTDNKQCMQANRRVDIIVK